MIRIGVCDDNAVILQNICSMIENAFLDYTGDFDVLSYTSGQLLYKAYMQERFDVIFLDIDMPKMSGFEVAKMLGMISQAVLLSLLQVIPN